jgi:hypothetical protein
MFQRNAHPINSQNNKHLKEKIRFHNVLERSVNRAADSVLLMDFSFCLPTMFFGLEGIEK